MMNTLEAFDDDMENIRARRNHLIAHWAAGRMGLDDALTQKYGRILHEADHEETGDADVMRKLKSDMAARGVKVDDAELDHVLKECHQRALRETHSTD